MRATYRSATYIDLSDFVRIFVVVALCLAACLALPSNGFGQQEDVQDQAIALFNEAQDLHEQGDLRAALDLYKRAIELFPEFPEAHFQKGSAEAQLGLKADAERSYRRAIELNPEWSLAMTSLAGLLIDRGEMATAEVLLKRALELEPNNPPAIAAYAEVLLRTNSDPRELEKLHVRLADLTSKANPVSQLFVAKAAIEDRLGRRKDAKATLERLLSNDPQHRAAMFTLAEISVADKDLVRANQLSARLIEMEGVDADKLNYLRANVFSAERQFDKALAHINQIKRPDTAAVDLKARLLVAGSTSTAEIEGMLATDPNNASLLGRLCGAFRRDEPRKAIEYCRRASELEPSNVDHAVGFAAALVQAKLYEQAVTVLTRVVGHSPNNSTARANLATALFQLKRYPEAMKEFRWMADDQPKAAAPYYFMAIIHDQLNEFADAMANYQQYLRLADPVANKEDIEKVNLRLPAVQRLVKDGKGKRRT